MDLTRRKTLRTLTLGAGATALTASGLLPARAAGKTTLRLHHFNSPRAAAQVEFLDPWAKAVMAASGGELDIQIYPSMQLGGQQRDLFNQVRDGVVDLAYSSAGFTPGELPMLDVFSLPFVTPDNTSAAPAVQEYFQTYMADQLKKGYRPLVLHTSVSTALHTTKPVKTPDDLKGLRLRSPNRVGGQLLSSAGAGVVNVPVPELTESISRGLIDGTPMAFAIANILKMQDVTDYHTKLPLTTVVFLLMINQRSYDRLSDKARAAIDANSGMDWAKKLGVIWDKDEEPAMQKMVDAGDTILTPTDEAMTAFKTLAEPINAEWVKETKLPGGADPQKMLDAAKALVAKHSAA